MGLRTNPDSRHLCALYCQVRVHVVGRARGSTNGRLIDPYEVVKVQVRTGNVELEQTGGDEASARLLHCTTI
jgi:hypothetical protein